MPETGSGATISRRIALAAGLSAAALFFWAARDAVLLAFGSILLGLLLSAAADRFSQWTRLPRPWTFAFTVVLLVGGAAAFVWMFGSQIGREFRHLATALPETIAQLRDRVEGTVLGQVVERATNAANSSHPPERPAMAAILGFARSLFEGMGNLLLVTFAGVYFAAQPDLYIKGALRLLPASRRQRAAEVLIASGHALRQWLIGQMAAMAVVGLLTGAGLWLLGIPAAFALAAVAAAAEFVPIVGPILAAVPAVLMALSEGSTAAIYVAALYLAIQQIESYILYPMIQREAVSLPPVITLFAIVAFAIVFGPLGAVFATPLAVILMVCVRMLYLEDVLGDRVLRGAPRP